jgi:radical SAM superfamily enzyme with C-terminal helix-hairpin-helix motif
MIAAQRAMESAMKRTLIRYKTRPDAADQNAGLIEKVFEELKAAKPDGVRYLSLRLDDNTFVHLVEAEEGSIPLPSLDAFKAFQSGIRERCVEPPVPSGVTIVGNYRMLSEN